MSEGKHYSKKLQTKTDDAIVVHRHFGASSGDDYKRLTPKINNKYLHPCQSEPRIKPPICHIIYCLHWHQVLVEAPRNA